MKGAIKKIRQVRNFYTGVNDSILKSLHFCGSGLTVSHCDCEFFYNCECLWLKCLYFRGLSMTLSHRGRLYFHRCKRTCTEKSAFLWIRSEGLTLGLWIFTQLWMVLFWEVCIFVNFYTLVIINISHLLITFTSHL